MKSTYRTLGLVLALAACGSTDGAESAASAEHSEHDHDQATGTEDDDFMGCPEGIPAFEPGLKAAGEHLEAQLVSATPTEPERNSNRWTVDLHALDGTPTSDAEITRGQTFMPVHGHDGRVEPQMKALSKPGEFSVDRLTFTMRGPWEVRLWLHSQSLGDDYLIFHVCVAK